MSEPGAGLIEELAAHYGVGQHYARAYATYWFESRQRTYRTLAEILADPQPYPMWFDYALQTNARGQALLERVRPELSTGARRGLDVGCGFGGVMHAFAAGGLEAVGIDLDPLRVGLAQANSRDSAGPVRAQVGDILDPTLLSGLGRFDLITCTDVIEHVLQPRQALANMVGLLNPGGLLYLEIPNPDSLRFVASDGHFGLFGITLLPRPAARRYHARLFDFAYDVGYYFPSRYYLAELEKLGCRTRLGSPPFQPVHPDGELEALFTRLDEAYQLFWNRKQPPLPALLRGEVAGRYWLYRRRFLKDWQKHQKHPAEGFRTRYLMDFWEIMAVRQA